MPICCARSQPELRSAEFPYQRNGEARCEAASVGRAGRMRRSRSSGSSLLTATASNCSACRECTALRL